MVSRMSGPVAAACGSGAGRSASASERAAAASASAPIRRSRSSGTLPYGPEKPSVPFDWETPEIWYSPVS